MPYRIRPVVTIVFVSCILPVFAYTQNTRPNKIDNLRTVSQIENLLESLDRRRFEVFQVVEPVVFKDIECQKRADKVKVKAWEKVDFDGNGLTDLLVNGRDYHPGTFVIMAEQNDKLLVKPIATGSTEPCSFAYVAHDKGAHLIKFEHMDRERTLIYKFGDFFEVNESPAKHRMERIVYETSMCYGTCPSFELVINADRTATYNAKIHNKQQGKFKGELTEEAFERLVEVLNYIDFAALENNYSVQWTDDQTSTLKITYDGGKTKTIKDYGLGGTFGLRRLYTLLFDLRETQTWR